MPYQLERPLKKPSRDALPTYLLPNGTVVSALAVSIKGQDLLLSHGTVREQVWAWGEWWDQSVLCCCFSKSFRHCQRAAVHAKICQECRHVSPQRYGCSMLLQSRCSNPGARQLFCFLCIIKTHCWSSRLGVELKRPGLLDLFVLTFQHLKVSRYHELHLNLLFFNRSTPPDIAEAWSVPWSIANCWACFNGRSFAKSAWHKRWRFWWWQSGRASTSKHPN